VLDPAAAAAFTFPRISANDSASSDARSVVALSDIFLEDLIREGGRVRLLQVFRFNVRALDVEVENNSDMDQNGPHWHVDLLSQWGAR
jgi:hypothetical protein